jgi:hypothetical protein
MSWKGAMLRGFEYICACYKAQGTGNTAQILVMCYI